MIAYWEAIWAYKGNQETIRQKGELRDLCEYRGIMSG